MAESTIKRENDEWNQGEMIPHPYFSKKMVHPSVPLLDLVELNYFTYITTEYHHLIEGTSVNRAEKFTILSQIRHLSVNSPHYNKL